MLTNRQKEQIIEKIEEELADMESFKFLSTTMVLAGAIDEIQIQVVITRDEDSYLDWDIEHES